MDNTLVIACLFKSNFNSRRRKRKSKSQRDRARVGGEGACALRGMRVSPAGEGGSWEDRGVRAWIRAGDNKAWLEEGPFLGTAENWGQKGDWEAVQRGAPSHAIAGPHWILAGRGQVVRPPVLRRLPYLRVVLLEMPTLFTDVLIIQ